MSGRSITGVILAVSAVLAAVPAPTLERVAPNTSHGSPLPLKVVGRVLRVRGGHGETVFRRQWPGTYVEAAFRGRAVLFDVGRGETSLRVTGDGGRPIALVRPEPGAYRLGGLSDAPHRLRIQVVSEDQGGATDLGAIYPAAGATGLAAPRAGLRQIEFIGDSYTVGYGNTSPRSECTDAQAWSTTDTSQAVGAQVGRRYGADVQVNAVSGRGVVRNYGGFAAPTVPEAYPFLLLSPSPVENDGSWRPQAVVVSLGTNDFTTPLHAGERWPTRAALHDDFEAAYLRFLRRLRDRNPKALLLVWSTDNAFGEITREASRVVQRLRQAGDTNVGFVEVRGLTFAACAGHPTVADDAMIASALARVIDAHGVFR